MRGDSFGRCVVGGQQPGGTGVRVRALAGGNLAVDRRADDRVDEGQRQAGEHDAGGREGVARRRRFPGGQPGEQRRVAKRHFAAAQQGGGARQLADGVGQPRDPDRHGLGHVGGNQVRDVLLSNRARAAQGPGELTHEERIAARYRATLAAELLRRVGHGVTDQPARGLLAEWLRAQHQRSGCLAERGRSRGP